MWMAAYWTKMSHRRNYGLPHIHQRDIEKDARDIENDRIRKALCNDRGTLQEAHKESLNPWTKDWRESLRKWESKHGYSDSVTARDTNKKAVQFLKKFADSKTE